MLLETRVIEIDNMIEELEYEIKIALLNERFQDAEDAKMEIADLERELESMGY